MAGLIILGIIGVVGGLILIGGIGVLLDELFEKLAIVVRFFAVLLFLFFLVVAILWGIVSWTDRKKEQESVKKDIEKMIDEKILQQKKNQEKKKL